MSVAGRTLKSLTEEVLAYQFSVSKYEPVVRQWLSDAQRKLVSQTEFRTQEELESYTTSASDNTLELPEDFSRWIDFFDSDTKGALLAVEPDEYDALEASSGRPRVYTVIGDQITLWPTPDASYGLSLRYWRLPQDMSADGDEPEIPPQYHELLIAYAMHKAYARENDYTASRFWKEEWEAGVMRMRGEVQHDTASQPEQVQGAWESERSLPLVVWP